MISFCRLNLVKQTLYFNRLMSTSNVVVTTAMVKQLREKTGAPMMDCKKALSADDVNGSIDKAIDWLRAKGIAKASTNSRNASEGLVGFILNGNRASLLEINSETGKLYLNW